MCAVSVGAPPPWPGADAPGQGRRQREAESRAGGQRAEGGVPAAAPAAAFFDFSLWRGAGAAPVAAITALFSR